MGKGEEDAPQRMAKGVQLSCGNGGVPCQRVKGEDVLGQKGGVCSALRVVLR